MKTINFLSVLVISAILLSCNSKPKVSDDTEKIVKDTVAVVKPDYTKIIAASVFIRPGKTREFIELFKGMTEKTLTEPGCTGYQLYQNPYEPTKFLVFETYKNQAAIDAHFAADYFKEFGGKIGPLTSQPSVIMIYDVAGQVQK
jgi:autoinducer 2-degrading protein